LQCSTEAALKAWEINPRVGAMRKRSPAIPLPQLVCAFEEPYLARSKHQLYSSFRMQKRLSKAPAYDSDVHASDGYYVFISLLCMVGLMISAILVAFGVEMFA
jgi:hypothetical protein